MTKQIWFGALVLVFVAVVAAGWTAVVAQDEHSEEEMKAWLAIGEPGPHHEHFQALVGQWDAKVSSWMAPGQEPMVVDAKSEYTLVMGGRYLRHEMDGTMMGMPYQGLGLSGYDNLTNKHTMMWIDNMSTQITFSQRGECKDHCNIEEHRSTMLSGTADEQRIRMVTTVQDKDHHLFEFFVVSEDGGEFKSMEIKFTRSM